MRILITAGPTREPIDAVRFISNRSTGQMGIALAEAAVRAGHTVTLLLGPVPNPDPAVACQAIDRFESAADLEQLLNAHFGCCQVLIMAAAVSDHRPRQPREGKLPRDGDCTLRLDPVPDLVAATVSRKNPAQKVVAFALEEPAHLEGRAREKMARKGVDAIVANPLGALASDRIEPVLLVKSGQRPAPGPMTKADFAVWLVSRLDGL